MLRVLDGQVGAKHAGTFRTSSASRDLAVEFVRLEFDYGRLSAALADTTLLTTFDGPGDANGSDVLSLKRSPFAAH